MANFKSLYKLRIQNSIVHHIEYQRVLIPRIEDQSDSLIYN